MRKADGERRIGRPQLVLITSLSSMLLLSSWLAATKHPAVSQETAGELHIRLERSFNHRRGWAAGCQGDNCVSVRLFEARVPTPPDAERVDIVATVTLDYDTTTADHGIAFLSYRRPDDLDNTAFRPGPWRLASPDGRMTSGTFVWIQRNVEAAGQEYVVQLTVTAPGEPDRGRDEITGRKGTLVVDVLPAG